MARRALDFLLRTEDIELIRRRPELETAILEHLSWLGLNWESPVRRQSDHLNDYAAGIDDLNGRGLLYRCFCNRKGNLDATGDAPHGSAEAARPGPLPVIEAAAATETCWSTIM